MRIERGRGARPGRARTGGPSPASPGTPARSRNPRPSASFSSVQLRRTPFTGRLKHTYCVSVQLDDAARTAGLVDEERLGRWMDAQDLPGRGEPVGSQFISGGASNEIFAIRRGEFEAVLRRPPRVVPKGRNETMLREYRVLAGAERHRRPPPRGLRRLQRRRRDRLVLLSHEPGRRLVTHEHGRVAGALRHRSRGPLRARHPAGRRHRPTGPGGLEGPGPRGVRQARRVPRPSGRPVAGPSRRVPVPRPPGTGRGRRLAREPTSRATGSRASSTGTTSSPT